jgi:TRAP-type uncharacterized transport system fused permease subunit
MKNFSSHFLESPHTQLGWLSVGLTVLFVALFVSVTTDLLQFSGFLTMTSGVIAGCLTLIALIWKHERSWLIWLMLLPGLFAILFAFGEILVPH